MHHAVQFTYFIFFQFKLSCHQQRTIRVRFCDGILVLFRSSKEARPAPCRERHHTVRQQNPKTCHPSFHDTDLLTIQPPQRIQNIEWNSVQISEVPDLRTRLRSIILIREGS